MNKCFLLSAVVHEMKTEKQTICNSSGKRQKKSDVEIKNFPRLTPTRTLRAASVPPLDHGSV